MHRTFLSGATLLLALTVGVHPATAVQGLPPERQTEIQNRVTNHFAQAVLFKPAEAGPLTPRLTQLAPLLIQAIAASNSAALGADQPAPGDGGLQVFVSTNQITLRSNPCTQISFWWNYSSPAPAQGVRLTLDSRGAPVIWEIRNDSSGADLIYIAQSLELRARAEFGLPLPGRRFAVETGAADQTRTIVAAIIDDGPMPMGPMVYLQSGSRDVITLLCRCMPAQFTTLRAQQDYQLVYRAEPPASVSVGDLTQRLRLPSRF